MYHRVLSEIYTLVQLQDRECPGPRTSASAQNSVSARSACLFRRRFYVLTFHESLEGVSIMRAFSALFAVLFVASAASADTTEWAMDPSHSHVGFSVKHLVVSSVSGRFKDVSANVKLDEADLTKSQVDITIKAASIDTDEPKRDEHLRSPDFFDTAKYPTLSFHATKIVKGGKGFKVSGDLKIKDVTKSVTLDGTLSRAVTSPWNKQVRAADFQGTIKRADFGLKWNKALEAGGVVVGEDVALDIQLELNK
jgi:polyisoprenoid-binding protein YceI